MSDNNAVMYGVIVGGAGAVGRLQEMQSLPRHLCATDQMRKCSDACRVDAGARPLKWLQRIVCKADPMCHSPVMSVLYHNLYCNLVAGGARAVGRLQGDLCKTGAHAPDPSALHAGEERWPQTQAF